MRLDIYVCVNGEGLEPGLGTTFIYTTDMYMVTCTCTKVICHEVMLIVHAGMLILWEATFTSVDTDAIYLGSTHVPYGVLGMVVIVILPLVLMLISNTCIPKTHLVLWVEEMEYIRGSVCRQLQGVFGCIYM